MRVQLEISRSIRLSVLPPGGTHRHSRLATCHRRVVVMEFVATAWEDENDEKAKFPTAPLIMLELPSQVIRLISILSL